VALEVFWIFLRLGLTSFGGPVAHIGYFRTEFVTRRHWLEEEAYAAIVSFCQFLPGPASSQVAMTLGLTRAGLPGLLAAWLGFTLPSALLMILFALFLDALGIAGHAPWVHGLKVATVAIVAQALWGMARVLTPDAPRLACAALAAVIALLLPTELGQVFAIVLGGVLGWALMKPRMTPSAPTQRISTRLSWAALLLFFVLLAGLPLLATLGHGWALFDAVYRAGALVFGGGHVVLPLLQHAMVAPGWIANGPFLAGYGAAQAMPGPLFSFAAFLGTAINDPVIGWAGGAAICVVAIYLPSVLLVAGGWPLWSTVAHHPALRAALTGTNAMVVGLVAAALYSSVWVGAIFTPMDFAIALAALGLLLFARLPSWAAVAFGAAVATMVARISGA
jgi:chromate transporter